MLLAWLVFDDKFALNSELKAFLTTKSDFVKNLSFFHDDNQEQTNNVQQHTAQKKVKKSLRHKKNKLKQ